jgi:hypothetical protein
VLRDSLHKDVAFYRLRSNIAFVSATDFMSRGSAVGIVTGCGLDDRERRNSSPGKVKNFHLSISSEPAPRPTQPPIQRVPGALSPGGKAAGV